MYDIHKDLRLSRFFKEVKYSTVVPAFRVLITILHLCLAFQKPLHCPLSSAKVSNYTKTNAFNYTLNFSSLHVVQRAILKPLIQSSLQDMFLSLFSFCVREIVYCSLMLTSIVSNSLCSNPYISTDFLLYCSAFSISHRYSVCSLTVISFVKK